MIDNTNTFIEAHHIIRINKLIQLNNEVWSLMDTSNEKQKVISKKITSGTETNRWWKTCLDQLNSRELYERYSRYS
ncbi:hypothetical protein J1N35_029802 [Gossypium stocksii]|uniref:Uncharacterized protein n=1 Tax=Gossypium stocksii TaxID=47602 RepID=A0A9D3UYA6_9ROSI|nr:hypothetical protein J1N35_029802 [Gossypium stocksii]